MGFYKSNTDLINAAINPESVWGTVQSNVFSYENLDNWVGLL